MTLIVYSVDMSLQREDSSGFDYLHVLIDNYVPNKLFEVAGEISNLRLLWRDHLP